MYSSESFSRLSYPERLTVVSAYIFILVPRGIWTHNPGVASTMLYQLSYTGPQYRIVLVYKSPPGTFILNKNISATCKVLHTSWTNPGFNCSGQMADSHHLMFQHDNAWPHVARICTLFLEAEHVLVLLWLAYSPDMSPIEHVWDTLDQCVLQHVPVPTNIQQLRTAIEEELENIPQATINSLTNSMPKQLCRTAWGKWWSHQILTGFLIHAPTFF